MLLFLRAVVFHPVYAVDAEDILFFLAAGFFFFLTSYEKNDGILRWYAFAGAGIGSLAYARTAGKWFEVFDNAGESVLVPYGEGKRLIDELPAEKPRYDLARIAALLEKAKPYTISVSAGQIGQMQKKGMLFTRLDGSIHVLHEDYFDQDIGIKEGNDLCSTLIL